MLNALVWNLLLTAALAVVLAGAVPFAFAAEAAGAAALALAAAVGQAGDAAAGRRAAAAGDLPSVAMRPRATAAADSAMPPGHASRLSSRAAETNPAADDATLRRCHARTRRDHGGPGNSPRGAAGRSLLGGLLAVSLIGTCVLLTVQAAAAAKLYRWLRRAATENPCWRETCAQVASRLEVRRVVRSCVVDVRTTPCCWAGASRWWSCLANCWTS